MPSDPFAELGRFLTATEAIAIAVQLSAGRSTSAALREVYPARREDAKRLLAVSGVGHADVARSVAVLHSIAGAKAVRRDVTPVWTMPGNEAEIGHLTSEFHRLVCGARLSVTCATYNFEQSSQMWAALQDASAQPGVSVTVYLDAEKSDAEKVKKRLPHVTVYRSATLPNGQRVISHAKFVVIDREVLLVTSANFSYSAELL
jgi:phosphatidylserine/phosphatidylglycerophosphate/cardiolipin synthase-like enzyme